MCIRMKANHPYVSKAAFGRISRCNLPLRGELHLPSLFKVKLFRWPGPPKQFSNPGFRNPGSLSP